ncbi:MAG TPA: NAD-dependent epimerase/dehydratase family protein [Candidatus Competibacteraceae bacterium]|nr:NAD-dependent epimerase/dehydratase family protein [Candidatus Competibacteraceae bacterium]
MQVDAGPIDPSAGVIALTGATGFIGGRLAYHLCSAGWQVRVLVRPSANTASLAGLEVQQIQGELENQDSLQRLVADTYAVIHCAGAVRGITAAQFNRINVAGVAHLVRAAVSQRPRFLLLSSLAAREPELSPYASSKQQGEQALATEAGDMSWIALRPPAVYGPGDKELLPLFQWMGRGIAPILGSTGARFSLLYVDDLATAVLRWLHQPQPVSGIFELHDGHAGGYGWDEVVAIAAALRARRIRQVPIPLSLLRLLAGLNVSVSRLGVSAPMLTPGKVRELRHPDWVCDNVAISRALGWMPQVELAEGLRRTLGWGEGRRSQ